MRLKSRAPHRLLTRSGLDYALRGASLPPPPLISPPPPPRFFTRRLLPRSGLDYALRAAGLAPRFKLDAAAEAALQVGRRGSSRLP